MFKARAEEPRSMTSPKDWHAELSVNDEVEEMRRAWLAKMRDIRRIQKAFAKANKNEQTKEKTIQIVRRMKD